ncbi:hypothetical protein GWI33_022485 [Rhynchophorus ferrugineus]|uniref:Uncharacterized protein n=1 Tax=Rhynchophorus ferrugineus TaxID=354439 RepID=A0A834MHJ1_RHYFE|nr:hypothetical protein GWI33_022485 [Rhynchophorus ferrugineus]
MTVINSDITSSFEDEDVSPLLDDDITTRGMARLSSAATCLVAGVEYTHGQQHDAIRLSELLKCNFPKQIHQDRLQLLTVMAECGTLVRQSQSDVFSR